MTQNKGTQPLVRVLSTSNDLTTCGVKRSLVLAPVLEKVTRFEAVRSTRASIIKSGTIPRTYTANPDRREHEIAKIPEGFRLRYAPLDAPHISTPDPDLSRGYIEEEARLFHASNNHLRTFPREAKPNQVPLLTLIPNCVFPGNRTSSPIMLKRPSASLLETVSPTWVSCLDAWWVHGGRGITVVRWLYVGGLKSFTRLMKLSNCTLVGARATLYTLASRSCKEMRRGGRGK